MLKIFNIIFGDKKRFFLLISLFCLIVLILSVLSFVNDSSDVSLVVSDSCDVSSSGAVILTASEGANGFGHTALLLYDGESWFYFSWHPHKAVFIEVPADVLVSFESFNSWVKLENSLQSYRHNFDSAIFIRGNFNSSIDYARTLFESFLESLDYDFVVSDDLFIDFSHDNPEYNLFFNNCLNVVYDVLSKGVLGCGISFNSLARSPVSVSNFAKFFFESQLDHVPFFSK